MKPTNSIYERAVAGRYTSGRCHYASKPAQSARVLAWSWEGTPGVSISLNPLGKPKGIMSNVVPGKADRVAPPTARDKNKVPKCLIK